jgi:hypothetical protein
LMRENLSAGDGAEALEREQLDHLVRYFEENVGARPNN